MPVHCHSQRRPVRDTLSCPQFARSEQRTLMKTDYLHGEMGLESCVYYSARRYVISRLSSSFNQLSVQMTASLCFFVGNRRSSMPYRTLEIKIRCINKVLLRYHRISVRWAPVISSLCVPRRIIHLPYVRHEQTERSCVRGSTTCVVVSLEFSALQQ